MKYYVPQYKTFSLDDVLARNSKWKNGYVGQHMVTGYDRHVIVKMSGLTMLVLYCHSFLGHLSSGLKGPFDCCYSFYALCDGWESFAPTGFERLHSSHDSLALFDDDEIKRRATEIIENTGFVAPDTIQQTMF